MRLRAFILICLTAISFAAQTRTPRLAVMPLADYATAPRAADELGELIAATFAESSFDVVDSNELAGVLRQHRIRNTSEPTSENLELLARETGAEYMLAGSLNHFSQFEREAEVSLTLRLISLPEGEVLDACTISRHSRNRIIRFPGTQRWKAVELAKAVVREAAAELSLSTEPTRRRAVEIDDMPLLDGSASRIAILPPANETRERFAGEIVGGQLLAYLERLGFDIVEPGLVRESMLAAGSLSHGEASRAVLDELAISCGADWVLTGVVRDYRESEGAGEIADCSAGADLRLINPVTGETVWARSVERKGSESAGLFGTNRIHGVSCLSNRLSKQLVYSIPSRCVDFIDAAPVESLTHNR